MAYNSNENFYVSVDEISSKGLSLTLQDKNEYKREYELSYSYIAKMEGDSYKQLSEISSKRILVNSNIYENDIVKSTFNWEGIYGKLDSGKYKFVLTSTSGCLININLEFSIDESGNLTYKEPTWSYSPN